MNYQRLLHASLKRTLSVFTGKQLPRRKNLSSIIGVFVFRFQQFGLIRQIKPGQHLGIRGLKPSAYRFPQAKFW